MEVKVTESDTVMGVQNVEKINEFQCLGDVMCINNDVVKDDAIEDNKSYQGVLHFKQVTYQNLTKGIQIKVCRYCNYCLLSTSLSRTNGSVTVVSVKN